MLYATMHILHTRSFLRAELAEPAAAPGSGQHVARGLAGAAALQRL